MIKSDIKKGDIYYATLNPAIGSEQKGERPVVVLQNDCGNKYSPTVISDLIIFLFNFIYNAWWSIIK